MAGPPLDSWWSLLDATGATPLRRSAHGLAGPSLAPRLPEELPLTTPDTAEVHSFLADVARVHVRASLDDLDRVVDPSFQLLLAASSTSAADRCAPAREIDDADVHGLRAALSALDAVLSMLVAHDLDRIDPLDHEDAPDRPVQPLLDMHPRFLRLAASGVTDLAEADASLRRAHAEAIAALDSLRDEGDTQDNDLLTWDRLFATPADEQRLREDLGLWRAALDGPTAVRPPDPRRVDLGVFFRGGVVLRDLLPRIHSFDVGGKFNDYPEAADVPPDPTLGGFLPDAARGDWLERWGKFATSSTPLGGRQDGVVHLVLAAEDFSLEGAVIDGPGADLRFHVPDASNAYDVELRWVDPAGAEQQAVFAGLLGNVDLDVGTAGVPYATEGTIRAVALPVAADAIEALH